MKRAIVYIHGKGGSAREAEHYVPLFPGCDVLGFDYVSETPWEARDEFLHYFTAIEKAYDSVSVIANSIGAYFFMLVNEKLRTDRIYLISPMVGMEKLIRNMMMWANVTEGELREKRLIATSFGETLSIQYLDYVTSHPFSLKVPADILYGEVDHLVSPDTITDFAEQTGSTLTVMKNGEHWFHTPEQMDFLDQWLAEHK